MLPSYRLFPRILRWFRRFRQRRGYGVHSPFAFEWLTDVVYNQQAQYYAYAPLSQRHKQWSGVLSIKDARLLFRIANHCRAKHILMVGQELEREKNYLAAARPSAQIVLLSDNQAVEQYLAQPTNTPPHFDFVLWMAAESPDDSTLSGCCTHLTKLPHAQRRGKPSSSRNGAPSLSTCTASEWLFTIPNYNDNIMSSTISNPSLAAQRLVK